MSAADPSKRVLMSMDDSSGFLKKPEKNAGSASGKSKTLRLELDLFEPDANNFPEFNYTKLVQIEKKKQRKIAKLPVNGNHTDPFGDDEGEVARISKELEAKYGTGSAYSKGSRLTTVDRGVGYDASDSFIDDTEAYDELIPDEIETDRGGFYINSGELEFKKLPNYERPGDEIRMPKAKKRALSTSSEESDSEEAPEEKQLEKPKKKQHAEKKVKTTATSSSDEQAKAKKLKKDKPEKPKEVPKEVQPQKEAEKKKDDEKSVKTTTVKDMLRAKRDSMLKKEQGGKSTTATDNDDEDNEAESVSSLAVSESSRDSHEVAPVNGSKDISLPESLPANIKATISALEVHAEAVANAKTPFFDSKVMDHLVEIDNGAKKLGSSSRVQVFNYMVMFVPCTKKTLFTKIRKHRTNQAESRVKSEINKLRKIVNESLPHTLAKYEADLKKYEEMKAIQSVVGDNSFENVMPRKKFHWNEASRAVLADIVRLLKDLSKVSGKNESEDEFVIRRLRENLIPLWPEGWVRLEDFQKEVERKKKKEAKAAAAANPQGSSQVQTKPPTASTAPTTNGKTSTQTQKTETNVKLAETEVPVVNGKASSHKSPVAASSVSTSVIKRSSDHSINSIISASPSPPATSQTIKLIEPRDTRVVDLEKLASPSELLKVAQVKSPMPRFLSSPVNIITPEKPADKVRRSDSSDSDCVEIVGEFNPIKPAKSPYHHNNNNKVNHQTTAYPAPVAKKTKKHGSDDGDNGPDYSKIIMGIQSLTDPKKSSQYLVHDPLSSPMNQQTQRKTETSHGSYELSNGKNDHFLDPKVPTKHHNHNNNHHYSIGDFLGNSSRNSHEGSVIKSSPKSSDHHKHYNHQQQLTSSTNNNLHSISMSLTSPPSQSSSHDRKNNYMMPSILNLSNKK